MDAATVETPALAQPLTPPATPAPAPAPITLEQLLAPDTLMRAWERVQRNGGAAGCDHQTIAAFGRHLSAELERLRAEVLQCDYTPRPLHLVPIPKRHGGTRTLAIPAVRDRVLQTALAQLLSPRIDANFNDDSYAYRPGRSVAQAVARVQECRRAGLVHVVDADIHGFFDHIDHARILRLFNEQVGDPDVGHLVALWLSAVMQGQGQRHLQVEGIAQGSPLSPLLANLYLDDFDRALQDAGLVSVRYADDFIVLCASAEQAAQALEQVKGLLEQYHLQLNLRKTRLTSFAAGFDFLGVRFRQHHVQALDPQSRPWLLPQRVTPPPQHHPHTETEPPAPTEEPLPSSAQPSEPACGWALQSIDPALDEPDGVPSDAPPPTTPATPDEAPPEVAVRCEPAAALLQSLYVGQPGCWLTKEHDRVVVSRDHHVLASVPLGQLDQIAIMHNVMLSSALLLHCAKRHVSVAIGGHGPELVTLERGDLSEQRMWRAQWAAQDQPSLQLMLASAFVHGKLHNSNTVLRRFSRREGRAEIEPHLQAIERLATQLIRAADMHQVRGLEGQGAKRYFAALRQLLPIGIDFAGRVRRPPRDPINVCLSLGYTVLATNLHTLVRTEGLNAHLGHLHASAAGSMALVSDLMEEFRAPVFDAVVLTLWRQGLLTDDDFEWADATDRDTLPCHLRSAGRRVLVDALEAKLQSTMVLPRTRRMLDVRRIMQSQVRHYLRVLQRQEAVYLPFKLR